MPWDLRAPTLHALESLDGACGSGQFLSSKRLPILMRVCLPPNSICSNPWTSGVARSLPPLYSHLITGPRFIKPSFDSLREGWLSSCQWQNRGKGRIQPVIESQHLQRGQFYTKIYLCVCAYIYIYRTRDTNKNYSKVSILVTSSDFHSLYIFLYFPIFYHQGDYLFIII